MTNTCRQVDALIARLAQLTPDEAATLEAHVAGCDACRELAHAMKPVSQGEVAFAATSAPATHAEDDVRARTLRDDLPEVTVDRYRITGEVGRGGIGRVLQARDQVLDRPVAVKELLLANDAMRRRFIREALITARLQHPSIVPVYDAGRSGDRSPFYAMKLVAGRPLDDVLVDATTLAQRLAVLPNLLAVADAMAYAHSERIIHRDLKPANVLVGKFGETIVIDWGLAKDLAVDDQDALDAGPYRGGAGLEHTVAGMVLGTPAYMAPEQAAGALVDERADVYALGAILYHVVSGATPHEGATLEEMVNRVIGGNVRPLTEREPEVPRDLAAIVAKAMAREPSERYASAAGFADDLRRFQTGQLVASHTYRTRELLRRWFRRHRAAVTVAVAALAVVSVVGIASVVRIVRAREQADAAAAVATRERSIAEQQKTSATEKLADLMTEQGRQELLAGRPARAAVYLIEAQAQSPDPGVALRTLLAQAMRSIDAERMSLDSADSLHAAAFSPDGKLIVTSGRDGDKVWDAATGKLVTALADDHWNQSTSFSPDSARIVTASSTQVTVWDARTGEALARLDRMMTLIPSSAAFSPDGTRIVVTMDSPAEASLWDAQTARRLVSLDDHRPGRHPLMAAVTSDGARVITASSTSTAKVWDVKTGKLLRSLGHDQPVENHRDDVRSAVLGPDDAVIVIVGDDDVARLWDARTGQLLASRAGTAPAFSRDGARIVTVKERTAEIWDARTGKLLTSLIGHADSVACAAFSPDGSRVVTASADHTAKLWDVATGKLLASFEGHRDLVRSAMFSPDGAQILTASWDGTAKLWDARPTMVGVSLGRIESARFGPGAKLVTTSDDNTAKLWDARSGTQPAALEGHRFRIESVDFDATGRRIATASRDHAANVWDASTGKLVVSLDCPHEVATTELVKLSPDGSLVVTACDRNGAALWNVATGTLIARLDPEAGDDFGGDDRAHELTSAAFSDDGRRLVTGSWRGRATLWSTDNGAPLAKLEVTAVVAAAFSRDGERLVTVSRDSRGAGAAVWDVRTGTLVTSLQGHTLLINDASFSPDGARIVTASADHTAKLWDARTGKLLASFDGHTDAVHRAVFSPDPEGARVLTASDDHTVKLWDTRTGKLLASLDGHSYDVAFSPDGTRVISAGRDGTLWIWDVRLEQRTPDAIRRIIADRDPWTLASGGLVPVPTERIVEAPGRD